MGKLRFLFAIVGIFVISNLYGADIDLKRHFSAAEIPDALFELEAFQFDALLLGDFTDDEAFSYVRLGIQQFVGMDFYNVDKEVKVKLTLTPYDEYDVAGTPLTEELIIYYEATGDIAATTGDHYFKMNGVHKVKVEVTDVLVGGVSTTTVPEFVFLEAGFIAERYY